MSYLASKTQNTKHVLPLTAYNGDLEHLGICDPSNLRTVGQNCEPRNTRRDAEKRAGTAGFAGPEVVQRSEEPQDSVALTDV